MFLTNVEQIPEFHVEVGNPSHWIRAIEAQKSSSARGIDGISGAELKQLPRRAIEQLATLTAELSQFPSWFMTVLTVALPKIAGSVQVSQIRPITIFAMLYRTWGRVISQQILCRFAAMMPSGITGFLKHRGPIDASMTLAFLLEKAKATDVHHTGVVLDLQKCFNTICRKAAAAIMSRLGVPDKVVHFWLANLGQMTRIWTINRQCGVPFGTNNGCPEGDSMSIVAMLSLGYLWLASIEETGHAPTGTCYADNWGWILDDPQHHSAILQVTRNFTTSARMLIDWKKTWTWATSKEFSEHTQHVFRTLLPDQDIPHVNSAMDLGCQHTYRGCPKLGQYTERISKAKVLLKRVQSMPHDLSTKSHLVMGGILPLAFYGLEVLPIGMHHLQNMRPGISNAVLGPNESRNSTMAIACTPRLDDPLVYIVLKILRSARRFVNSLSQADRDQFFHLVSNHTAKFSQCHGPAGCLAYYLDKVDWMVDEHGQVWVTDSVSFPLMTMGIKVYRLWLELTRQKNLLEECTQRDILHGLVINTFETKRVLAQFGPGQQQQLLNEISGGFQLATQKCKWANDADDRCAFCDAVDSRFHRVHECEAFAHLRQPHQVLLDSFLNETSLIHELPVIFQHADLEVLQTAACHHIEAQLESSMQQKLTDMTEAGQVLNFYTDGSLQFPSITTARHGAYAIVFDTCLTDMERRAASDLFLQTGQLPSSLKVLSVARVTGRQTIHRAELFAVVKLCEWFSGISFHSDCQNVLDLLEECREVTHVSQLVQSADFDLISRLWCAIQRRHHFGCKVKAHQNPREVADSLERYHALGNQVANDAAVNACKYMYPAEARLWTEMATGVQTDIDRLQSYYQYILTLHTARAKQEQLDNQQSPHGLENSNARTQLDLLSNWVVPDPWLFPDLKVNFARKLEWPDPDTLVVDDPGITYIELAVSFMLDTGCYIPIKRPKQDGVIHLYLPSSHADAVAQHAVLAEQGLMFAYWIHQMCQLISPPPLPVLPVVACKGLYRLGARNMSKGYAKRPRFPAQVTAMALLSDLSVRFGIDMPQQTLPLNVSGDVVRIRSELVSSLAFKQEKVKRAVQEVRGLTR
eukprot:Skav223958  [mRNA]  locus=scaffold3540:149971:153246:+ [translate_table: standard]